MEEIEQDQCETRGSRSFLAFLLGSAIGSVLGVLYAPGSGEETRRRIKFYTEEAADKVVEKMQHVRDESVDAYERAREVFSDKRGRLATALDAGKRAFSEEQQHLEENG